MGGTQPTVDDRSGHCCPSVSGRFHPLPASSSSAPPVLHLDHPPIHLPLPTASPLQHPSCHPLSPIRRLLLHAFAVAVAATPSRPFNQSINPSIIESSGLANHKTLERPATRTALQIQLALSCRAPTPPANTAYYPYLSRPAPACSPGRDDQLTHLRLPTPTSPRALPHQHHSISLSCVASWHPERC
jgi:hypothetical protein